MDKNYCQEIAATKSELLNAIDCFCDMVVEDTKDLSEGYILPSIPYEMLHDSLSITDITELLNNANVKIDFTHFVILCTYKTLKIKNYDIDSIEYECIKETLELCEVSVVDYMSNYIKKYLM